MYLNCKAEIWKLNIEAVKCEFMCKIYQGEYLAAVFWRIQWKIIMKKHPVQSMAFEGPRGGN